MAKEKNKHYETYRRLWDEMLSLDAAIHQRSSKQLKKMSEIERVAPICHMNPMFASSLDHAILGEERYWERQGALTLFPDDQDVITLLQRARFDVSSAEGLQLPSSSFMLTLPKGYSYKGIEMPGCLVTWLPIKEYNQTIFYPLDQEMGYSFERGLPSDMTDPEQMSLSICFIDPKSRTPYTPKHTGYARNRVFVESHKIPKLLVAQTNEEFYTITGRYQNGDMAWVTDLEDDDITMERCYLQLVLAISVYYTATEGACLSTRMPTGKVQLSPRPKCPIKGMTITHQAGRHPSPVQQRDPASPRREHLRSWHFRQLRHERYYQGKYADWPRGSRIVFVSESFVGQ